MAITLTKYIYPIKEEITLSKTLGISIDNPRTEEEIRFIREYIHPALVRNYESHKPNNNPMLSAAVGISTWREYIKGRDEYVYDFLHRNYETQVEDIISQCWIIIRYPDNGEFDKAKIDRSVFFDIFFTEARHDYWEKYYTLLSYCQFISLLIHDERDGYEGRSFVLFDKPQDIFYPIDHTHEIIEAFSRFHGNCSIGSDNRGKTWDFFPDVQDQLVRVANTLELTMASKSGPASKGKQQTPKEKILFVGNLLRVIEAETGDINVKLLLLVSIIEFMVTRNPAADRFNVEDSISKQFVLKASVLIYQHDIGTDLEVLRKNLKQIYNQRSNVAHGNHNPKGSRKEMEESFFLLFKYIRAIVLEYIRDPVFVDFLKEN